MTTSPISQTQFGKNEQFELQVARGQIPGHEVINIFGYSTAITSAAFIPAWEVIGAYVFPTVASAMLVTSSSASDTAVTVRIEGLNINYDRISELVVLTGTTAVTTTQEFFRINGVATVSGNAVGTVYVKDAGAVVYAQIAIGSGRTNMSVYTVPRGFTAYLTQFDAFSSTSVTSGVYATFRALFSSAAGVNNVILSAPFLNTYAITRPYPNTVVEKTDIQLQCKSSGAALGIAAIALGVLVANNY